MRGHAGQSQGNRKARQQKVVTAPAGNAGIKNLAAVAVGDAARFEQRAVTSSYCLQSEKFAPHNVRWHWSPNPRNSVSGNVQRQVFALMLRQLKT